MAIQDLIGNVIDALTGRDHNQQDQNVLPASQDPMGDPADQQQGFGGFGNVLPASQDPMGDPADQGYGNFGNVLPASQDPMGDPADQGFGGFGNVLPASQDPLGDPADEEERQPAHSGWPF